MEVAVPCQLGNLIYCYELEEAPSGNTRFRLRVVRRYGLLLSTWSEGIR